MLAPPSHRAITRSDKGFIENRTGNSLWWSDLERSRGSGWVFGTISELGSSRTQPEAIPLKDYGCPPAADPWRCTIFQSPATRFKTNVRRCRAVSLPK